jgi:hypothetical protein
VQVLQNLSGLGEFRALQFCKTSTYNM